MHPFSHHFDTVCRFAMRRNGSLRRGGNQVGQALPGKWGLRLCGLINQKDRNAIPNRIGLGAARALKRSAIVAEGE